MRHVYSSACIALLLLLGACSSQTPKQPGWIAGNSIYYPEKTYLIGRGQSEYRSLAQDRARADLAKIFEVRLAETSEDEVHYQSDTQKGEQQSRLQSSSNRLISTRTKQILQGVRIAEIWQDPQSGEFHALAVLDRNQVGNILYQRIKKLDEAAKQELNQIKETRNVLAKIAHANRAIEYQQQREVEQRLYQIVDPTGRGLPQRYILPKLMVSRDSLLQRVSINSEVARDPLGDMETIINGAIASAGFRLLNSDKAAYTLVTELQLDKFKDADGWHWYRGSLQIELYNNKDDVLEGSHRWDIKVAAQKDKTALQRVRATIDKTLRSELRKVIVQFGLAE